MRAAPSSERMTLTADDMAITGDIDGMALRFGPGPAVTVLPSVVFRAIRVKAWATWALEELADTLAKTSTQKDA
jgi:hypothetical protein